MYVLSLRNVTTITAYRIDGTPLPFNVNENGCLCTGLAVSPSGEVIESVNAPTDQLQVFNPDGSRGKPIVHLGPMYYGVAVAQDGRIFALSLDQPGDGIVNTLLPGGQSAAPSFNTHQNVPRIAVSRDGRKIYVSSETGNNVKIFDPQGNQLGKPITDGVNGPLGIAVGVDGKIYVANQVKVTVYDADGKKLPVEFKHDNDGAPFLPGAVAVGVLGWVYVGYNRGGVGVFHPDGSFVQMIKAPDEIVAVALH